MDNYLLVYKIFNFFYNISNVFGVFLFKGFMLIYMGWKFGNG